MTIFRSQPGTPCHSVSCLELGFLLGQPEELHLQHPSFKKPRIKTTKQRQRDKERAATFQARQAASAERSGHETVEQTASSESSETLSASTAVSADISSQEVKLPQSGVPVEQLTQSIPQAEPADHTSFMVQLYQL